MITTPAMALLLLSAFTLLAASAIHGGLFGPIDPFPGAAIPEAVIGVVVGIGAIVRRPAVAIGTTVFAILGTLYGLTATLPRGEAGDIAYHLGLLALLVVAAVLMLRQQGTR